MKFASVSFCCQVSDTGSVGWASSLTVCKISGKSGYTKVPYIIHNYILGGEDAGY